MAGVIALALVLQLVLVSLRNHQRVLLPSMKPQMNTDEHR
jgi:hypothetical protein